MQKYLLLVALVFSSLLMGRGVNAQLYCSPYISSPCYRDFYYPGIYQEDIGFACAEQISYYQTSYNELNQAKNAFYKTEPRVFQSQLKSYDRRVKQIRTSLGNIKARRDALVIRSGNLSGVISQSTQQGFLFQNSKFVASTLRRYNQRLQSYQATIDRYNLQILNLENELQLLSNNRTQFINNRNTFLAESQDRLAQLLNNYYDAKKILQQCIYIVVRSAYN